MPALSYAERQRLRASQFAIPSRAYPIDTEERARNALARVSQYGTPAERAQVRGAVHRRYPGISCASCGNTPAHLHGKHGCCGDPACHRAIETAHYTAGERGTPRDIGLGGYRREERKGSPMVEVVDLGVSGGFEGGLGIPTLDIEPRGASIGRLKKPKTWNPLGGPFDAGTFDWERG